MFCFDIAKWPARRSAWLLALIAAPVSSAVTFNYTGSMETWTVPNGVTSITVDVRGSQGGDCIYNNAAKYALEGSRIYADLKLTETEVVFSLKNVSEQPLNISADELTERFIRGDVSRSTEGSGLGLSIARDLAKLMNAKFELYLDGDLFRVTITFARIND